MSKFSVRKPLTVLVAVVAIIVIGAISYTKLTPDLLPNMDFPYVMVMTTYPGATPEEVEATVTKPLEKSLSTLDGVKTVGSVSGSNYSMVGLEFNTDTDMGTVTSDVVQQINLASAEWGDTIGTPTVLKLNPNMIPINATAVSIKGMDTAELSQFCEETLTNELEGTEGVAGVDSFGMIDTNINVVLDQDKIDAVNDKMVGKINSSLAGATSKINNGEKQVAAARRQLNKKKAELSAKENSTYSKLAGSAALLDSAQAKASALEVQISTLEIRKASLSAQVNAGLDSNGELRSELNSVNRQLAVLNTSKGQADAQVNQLQKNYEKVLNGGYSAVSGFSQAKVQLSQAESALDNSEKQLASARRQLASSQNQALASADMSSLLTMDSVSQILKAQNFSMPAGYAKVSGGDYMVSVGDEFDSFGDIENLVLFDTGSAGVGKITLSQVANVYMSDNKNEIYATLDGEPGVLFTFNKQSDYAVSDTCKNLQHKFEELQKKYDGLSFSMLYDQGYYIKLVVKSIFDSLIWGALFAVLIILLFLKDVKPTIITMCSIPISVVFAVVLMYFSGVSLNMMSLSGLAIAVGMLVDNSVVVIENIMRMRRDGIPATKAAVAGAKQVSGAITASTLTTICVFVPIVFVDGITRQLFTDMALTVVYSLFASLIIALTLVPSMSSLMLRNIRPYHAPYYDRALRWYKKAESWALGHRLIILGAAAALLVLSIGLAVVKGFIFMPSMSSPEVQITLESEDKSFDEVTEMSDTAVERIQKIDEVQTVGAMIGNSSTSGFTMGDSSSANTVTMYVMLDEKMKRSSDEICNQIENQCSDLDCEITAGTVGSVDTYMEYLGGAGVSVNVFCDDMDRLQQVACDVGSIISKVEGIDEVDDGLEELDTEIHFTVDKNKASSKGLTVAQVYTGVSALLKENVEASSVNIGGVDYDMLVSDNQNSNMTVGKLKNSEISVKGADGTLQTFKVKDVASVKARKAMPSINRDDQRRYITVTGTVDEQHNITLVEKEVEKAVDKYNLPKGAHIEYSGQTDTIMEAMKQLGLMVLAAILLVYLVMVAQFQSLKSPLIIMFTIPLAFTGGLLALLVTGKEISVISMVGFVMLVGIIVNNGIVLVDYVNQLRARGRTKRDALVEAGMTRMRPVLMTSLTTVLGLSVMAFGKTAGTDMMQPVALVCIGGLIYATALTLVVVPIIYDLMHKEEYKFVSEEDLDVRDVLNSRD